MKITEDMIMKNINYFILIVILLITSTSFSVRADTASAIEALNSALMKKFKAGEISDMIGLYTENAVMLPPSSEILSSPESIKRYWDNLREVGVNDYSIYLVELNIEGDVAYATSLWEAKRITTSGDVITLDGNISTVFEKQNDGSWKIKLQSWN